MALRVALSVAVATLYMTTGCYNREYRWYSEEEMCWHYGDVPQDWPERDECCSQQRWQKSEIRLHIATGVCWQLPQCWQCLWPEFDIREDPEPNDFMLLKWGHGTPPDGFCPRNGREWRLPQYTNMEDCP